MRRQSTLGSLGSSGKPVEAGRPGLAATVRHMEAGLCWSRFYIKAGSPTMREAHYYDLHRHGSWIMPVAVCCVHGKPERGRGGR